MKSNDELNAFIQELTQILNERYEKSYCKGYDDVTTIFNKGCSFAYYDVLDIIKQQLIVIGNDSNDFGSTVPTLKPGIYTYTEFVNDLGMGREIEFLYKNSKYSITNTPNGHVFSEYNSNFNTYQTIEELIKRTRIDNKNLKELWEEITIDCIF
ncbi:hypothetical protein ACFQI7_03290 [Paenibacillus allorhizosphaerae]|uniref:hypothetical protein n=2 Tax=Paenibacillus allorhizosphaerae TaxID=2849866 RepID=UPI00361E1A07